MALYRVAWKSNLTGASGAGLYLERATADAWLYLARCLCPEPEFSHWIEKGPQAGKR